MSIQLTLHPDKTHQTIEGFGASGAWWAQVVGGWPEDTRRDILKLLYSKQDGIGMTTYRYNLGGGSKESGKGRFPNLNRRASNFLASDGSYDWSRDEEALWCLREAVRMGADDIVLFVNSPPECWTTTGMAQAKLPFRANLPRKNEEKFCNYVLDVAEHLIQEGIPVTFISPINEPFGFWIEASGQEGCHYHPAGVRRLLRRFALEMDKRPALKNVQLSGAENNDLRLMNKTYTRAVLDDPIIRTRVDGIDVHGYIFKPLERLKGVKQRFRKYMDRRYPGVPVRMTEWTHMQGGRDYGMGSALEMAKTIWEDMSIMDVISWQHWIAVSEVDFCDGLIYIDEDTRTFSIPKRYYAFGNYTKFVPTGAVRIEVSCPSPALQCLAFQAPQHTAVILVNPTEESVQVSLGNGQGELHTTSESKDLARQAIDLTGFALEPRSVNTVVIHTS